MKSYVRKANGSIKNCVHVKWSLSGFSGPRLQPAKPKGKSGTAEYIFILIGTEKSLLLNK